MQSAGKAGGDSAQGRPYIAARLAEWQAPEPRFKSGVFHKYAALVSSAAEGAITRA